VNDILTNSFRASRGCAQVLLFGTKSSWLLHAYSLWLYKAEDLLLLLSELLVVRLNLHLDLLFIRYVVRVKLSRIVARV
jgi:hypothetical protein